MADRAAAVAHIQISPGKFVGYLDEGTTFTAMPSDSFDRTIQGVKFSWESSNTNKLEIDEAGRARFLQAGPCKNHLPRRDSIEATAHSADQTQSSASPERCRVAQRSSKAPP